MQVVNRRWCNVHVQGSLGAKGGASKMQEAKGSRFTTLSTESPNGVEIEDELQLVEEENGVHVSSPVGQLAAMGNAIDTPVNVGKVDEQQHKRQIAQGKRVGTVSGVGKSLAGKVVPTVDSELGEIQIGGVGMESMLFAMAPVDIVCLVEKEQRDSSPMTALPLYIEQEVIFDPGGSI
ncbi:hypothetical protein V6N13_043760 [Hibiscus sabdariffa]